MSIHVSPGERNPIEGKFGQAKTAYGLDRIKARLKGTSESWIATIILVLNLVKLAGVVLLYPFIKYLSFSARLLKSMFKNLWDIFNQIYSFNQIDYSPQVLYLNVA
jgi:IS5 family transposase